VVIDSTVDVGSEVHVAIAEEAPRPARVVWARDEGDGQIVGLEFL
jgi:hypothetical protein